MILAELDRVADQILKQLRELRPVRHHDRQRLRIHLGAGVGNPASEQPERLLQGCGAVHRRECLTFGADARIGKDVQDEILHALRAVHREAH